jgi:hypothetical protein
LLAHNKVAFFYNSVKEISNIVNQMPDTSDVEVLCAKTELHEASVPCYSKEFNPKKQIHFMTSAYFTGMDIDKKHHFGQVVFVGGNSASYLAYSNKTVKQALGRFRGGYDNTAFIADGKVKDKFGYAHMKSMITKFSLAMAGVVVFSVVITVGLSLYNKFFVPSQIKDYKLSKDSLRSPSDKDEAVMMFITKNRLK